jgi:dTDP-4-dehydrorhamnose 3,5-epimerase
MLQIETFPIAGLKLVTLRSFPDSRGFFVERFKRSAFLEAGLPVEYVQDNFSRSSEKVLRGLHYQWDQPQGKLVTCTKGRIFDVAIDVRAGSPTFGKHASVELDGEKPQWFWIPPGFAHGFAVLSKEADMLYKCTAEYNAKGESGIRWSDPELKIQWPHQDPLVSPKDIEMQSLQQYAQDPKFTWRPS